MGDQKFKRIENAFSPIYENAFRLRIKKDVLLELNHGTDFARHMIRI